MKKLFTKNQIMSTIKITVLSAILIVGLNYANAAWSGPTATAPDGNTPAPVNIGTLSQIKNGGLGLNALSVFGNGLFTGKATANRFCFTDGSCVSSWPEACAITQTSVPTVSLTANPSNVAYNGNTTLTWSSTNATGCSADWTNKTTTADSETKTNLTTGQTYTITCTGTGGSAQDSATVTVGSVPAVPTVTLTANPSNVAYNGNTTLTWSSTNATGCSADWASSTATSGSQGLYNLKSSQTYMITCTGAGGSKSASVTVGSACTQKTFYKDADGDNFPVGETTTGCFAPAGYIEVTPTQPVIGPINIYNMVINGQWDCDDNNKTVQVAVDGYLDKDGDGYAPNNATRITCTSWASRIATKLGDCNDNNKDVHPGASFRETEDSVVGWDYNCDGTITKQYNQVGFADDWLYQPPGIYVGYKSYGMCSYQAGWVNLLGYNPRLVNVSDYSCGTNIGSTVSPKTGSSSFDYDVEYCNAKQCTYVDNLCTKIGYYPTFRRQGCK